MRNIRRSGVLARVKSVGGDVRAAWSRMWGSPIPTGIRALDVTFGGGVIWRPIVEVNGREETGSGRLGRRLLAGARRRHHPCMVIGSSDWFRASRPAADDGCDGIHPRESIAIDDLVDALRSGGRQFTLVHTSALRIPGVVEYHEVLLKIGSVLAAAEQAGAMCLFVTDLDTCNSHAARALDVYAGERISLDVDKQDERWVRVSRVDVLEDALLGQARTAPGVL